MTKFRTALLALTVAFTVAGGTGAAAQMDAGKSSISKVQTAKKNGDSWCC
jgi:hypothetical protein